MTSEREIEDLLRKMPLAAPPARLDERVAETLGQEPAPPIAAGRETRRADAARDASSRRSWWLGAAAGALAAAAAVIVAVGLPRGTQDASAPQPPAPSATIETGAAPGPVQVAAAPAPPSAAPAAPPSAAPAASPAVPGPVVPVRLEQNWSELSYEGLVFPDPHTPLRQFRHRMIERVQTFDPQRGIRMETTVPREEIILIRAPLQ
ncbi:MAG: hypothetical protein FJ288_03195 [Planctomycetes bacterium]|nr:hypothetical protein [Planctomycetota bacterium]